MRAAVVTAPGQTRVVDVPMPTVGPAASHTIPFDRVDEALRTAATPGAADKVVVTFN